jgi:flagellar basal-body rod protein FlgC
MSYNQLYAIALDAMNVEKLKIDVVANNIANQHTLINPKTQGFQAQTVLTVAKPFSEWLSAPNENAKALVEIKPQALPPTALYQPGHPAADDKGYIYHPGMSTVDEMTTLMRASRAYEANIKIINTAHSLYMQALSIGDLG